MRPTPLSMSCVPVAVVTLLVASIQNAVLAMQPARSPTTRTASTHRVTLLGVARGVSYLDTAAPVDEGNRSLGAHPVEWLQVKLLVECRGDRNPLGWYKWHVRTLDGDEFVAPRSGRQAASRASSALECDLSDPRLPGLLYPAAVPKSGEGTQTRVLILGLSGKLLRSDNAELTLSLGDSEGDAERLTFRFPMP